LEQNEDGNSAEASFKGQQAAMFFTASDSLNLVRQPFSCVDGRDADVFAEFFTQYAMNVVLMNPQLLAYLACLCI
jgi:hypothetical protein